MPGEAPDSFAITILQREILQLALFDITFFTKADKTALHIRLEDKLQAIPIGKADTANTFGSTSLLADAALFKTDGHTFLGNEEQVRLLHFVFGNIDQLIPIC